MSAPELLEGWKSPTLSLFTPKVSLEGTEFLESRLFLLNCLVFVLGEPETLLVSPESEFFRIFTSISPESPGGTKFLSLRLLYRVFYVGISVLRPCAVLFARLSFISFSARMLAVSFWRADAPSSHFPGDFAPESYS